MHRTTVTTAAATVGVAAVAALAVSAPAIADVIRASGEVDRYEHADADPAPLATAPLGATARGADVPYAALTLEALALVALGLAVPMALRRWWQVLEPALVTGPLLFGAMLAAGHLPRGLTMLPGTPLDPTWDSAHDRWAMLLLAAVALVAAGAGDPATARTRVPRRRR